MNFSLNENQAMIAQMVRDFAEKEIKPFYKQWDADEHFPVETMKKMGELGLLGIYSRGVRRIRFFLLRICNRINGARKSLWRYRFERCCA